MPHLTLQWLDVATKSIENACEIRPKWALDLNMVTEMVKQFIEWTGLLHIRTLFLE